MIDKDANRSPDVFPRNLAVLPDPWQPGSIVPAPLTFYSVDVPPAWVDYHAHMSEPFYLLACSETIDPIFEYIGCNESYRATGHSFYSVAWRLDFLSEVRMGDRISVETTLAGHDARKMLLSHSLCRDHNCVATAEQLLVHVDTRAGKGKAMPEGMANCLAAIREAHAHLGLPKTAGRGLSLSRT